MQVQLPIALYRSAPFRDCISPRRTSARWQWLGRTPRVRGPAGSSRTDCCRDCSRSPPTSDRSLSPLQKFVLPSRNPVAASQSMPGGKARSHSGDFGAGWPRTPAPPQRDFQPGTTSGPLRNRDCRGPAWRIPCGEKGGWRRCSHPDLRSTRLDQVHVFCYHTLPNRTFLHQIIDAVHGQIIRSIAMMRDDCEMFHLLHIHCIGPGEIANINDIGLNQLIQCRIYVVSYHWSDHSLVDRRKCMRHEPEPAQLQVDLSKDGLVLVNRDERHFDLNRDGFRQSPFPVL